MSVIIQERTGFPSDVFRKTVDDLDDVTDGTVNRHFTDTEKTKLSNIEEGAQENVNSDWDAVSGDAEILNKPVLGTAASADTSDFATASQGSLADTAVQPAAISDMLETSDIGVTVQGYDADTAKLDEEGQTLSGGAAVTSKSLGTVSSGTTTLDMGDRPLQDYTNNGAHTLGPGSVTGSCLVDITNGASAGVITTSGWTKVAGDSFTTVNGDKFRCHCSVGPAGSLLIVQALQ